MTVTIENVPEHRFTEATVKKMYRAVWENRLDRKLQDLAAALVRGCPHKDYICFGNKILAAVKKLIPYIPDPYGIERVQSPWVTLETRRADCDDFSILIASLATAVGMDYRFVTVAARRNPKTGDVIKEWSHVYVILRPPGHSKWYGADAVILKSDFGWEAKGYEKYIWPKTR